MLERYRSIGPPLIVLAICALALIAAGQTGDNGDQTYRSGEYTYAANEQASPIREPAVVGLFPPKYRPEAAYKSYETAQYDLVAQRWMAWLTGLIATFTGIGVFLLWATLRDTRKIVGEAEDATEAAWAAVKATEDIGYRQTRAYPTLESAMVRVGDEKVEVMLEFLNSGQTPALHMKITEHFSTINLIPLDGSPRPKMMVAIRRENTIDMPIGTIGSGKEKTTAASKLNFKLSDIAAVDQFGSYRLFGFEAILEWEDAFERKHEEAIGFSGNISHFNSWLGCSLRPRIFRDGGDVEHIRKSATAFRLSQSLKADQNEDGS